MVKISGTNILKGHFKFPVTVILDTKHLIKPLKKALSKGAITRGVFRTLSNI